MTSAEVTRKKRFLKTLVPLLEEGGCRGEAVYLREESLSINKDNASTDVSRDLDEGVKLRVFDGREYHERGVSGWEEDALRKAARTLGLTRPRKDGVKLSKAGGPSDADYSTLGKIDAHTVPLARKMRDVTRLHAALRSASKRLVNARAYYDDSREIKIYAEKGRAVSQVINGCQLFFVAYVKSADGDVRYHFKSYFDHGYERVNVPKAELVGVARFAERVATAKRLKPGKYTCLLSPGVTGLLAHESFGHGMEADTIRKGRARAGAWLGKRLAGTHVTIADGPLEPGSHGFFYFDDEGMPATKALMIDKGVVTQPLTDAYSAAVLKVPRSSNARMESFDHKVYARMTNTYFEPGKESKASLLKRIKNGLYLHNASGGMEDPKGWGIQIQGVTAERVKNGKLTGELYYEIGMTGYLPTLLKNIVGVSKEFEIPGSGRCGKGHHDWVRVAEGGPYLLIKDVVLS